MAPIATVLFTLSLLSTGIDPSLNQYLAVRKKLGITQAVGVEALETFVGTRTIEVRGLVKGTFRVGDTYSLLLEKSDGDTYVVDTTKLPMWLVGADVPARLLVTATRTDELSQLKATLIAAAHDEDISAWETKHRPKPPPTYSAPKTSRDTSAWNLPASQVTPIYAAFIKSQNRRLTNSGAMRIAEGIVGFSLRFGVDARLIMAMVMVESGFDPGATSHSGAMGLGQLMPGTARWMGVSNAYDSVDNLYGTVKLIRTHLDGYKRQTGQDFASLVLALAAYNAGEGAVARAGGVPPYRETQAYIRKVIGLYYAFLGRA